LKVNDCSGNTEIVNSFLNEGIWYQVPVKKWHDIIGEKTLADAILDRIVHQSIRIELFGESLRKKPKENAEDLALNL